MPDETGEDVAAEVRGGRYVRDGARRARAALRLAGAVGLAALIGGMKHGATDQRPSTGVKFMDQREFITRLRRIDPENGGQIVRLAHELRHAAQDPIEAAAAEWKGTDPTMSRKARRFLSEMNELAIGPLADSPAPATPSQRVWLAQTVVAADLELRGRVAGRLFYLLDDRTQLPLAPRPPDIEGQPIPRRVCDEVYIELRRLLNSSEAESAYYESVDRFLMLTNAERDAAIADARRTPPVWTRFGSGSH
jgi:hypothetical protein